MRKAENKLNQQEENVQVNDLILQQKSKKEKVVVNPKGKKPDVTNLKVSLKDDPLQFEKIEKIDDKA